MNPWYSPSDFTTIPSDDGKVAAALAANAKDPLKVVIEKSYILTKPPSIGDSRVEGVGKFSRFFFTDPASDGIIIDGSGSVERLFIAPAPGIVKTNGAAIRAHGGRDNVIERNIIADFYDGIVADDWGNLTIEKNGIWRPKSRGIVLSAEVGKTCIVAFLAQNRVRSAIGTATLLQGNITSIKVNGHGVSASDIGLHFASNADGGAKIVRVFDLDGDSNRTGHCQVDDGAIDIEFFYPHLAASGFGMKTSCPISICAGGTIFHNGPAGDLILDGQKAAVRLSRETLVGKIVGDTTKITYV